MIRKASAAVSGKKEVEEESKAGSEAATEALYGEVGIGFTIVAHDICL